MSRSTILTAIRQAQGTPVPMPEAAVAALHDLPNAAGMPEFIATLDLIGARVIRGRSLAEAATWLRENVPATASLASTIPELPGTMDLTAISDPHALDGIHTAILPARFGVCENGAVWLDETELGPHRVLPFIAEHLFIVLRASDLVPTLHQAYDRIAKIGTGFGLFLAGPSKTADIEQCLVIGAHGARGATVFILD
ncbi:LUD domain-containing protein [Prosthecobacter sp. SYSU 5D2]|uniref:LutC/YkgG family protein n=1 Tax=Prosthecobacter sp. SYSU 5D2 TaxID=3134134 RepID=UPI0031FF253B